MWATMASAGYVERQRLEIRQGVGYYVNALRLYVEGIMIWWEEYKDGLGIAVRIVRVAAMHKSLARLCRVLNGREWRGVSTY